MSADTSTSKRRQAESRCVVAKLLLRRIAGLYDRLGDGALSEAVAIKSVLEVLDKPSPNLPAVAARIEDQMKHFKGPGDGPDEWSEEASILLCAWAVINQAIELDQTADAEPDDIGAQWLKWTRDRDFNVGGADNDNTASSAPGGAA